MRDERIAAATRSVITSTRWREGIGRTRHDHRERQGHLRRRIVGPRGWRRPSACVSGDVLRRGSGRRNQPETSLRRQPQLLIPRLPGRRAGQPPSSMSNNGARRDKGAKSCFPHVEPQYIGVATQLRARQMDDI